jgi:aminopeptidase N
VIHRLLAIVVVLLLLSFSSYAITDSVVCRLSDVDGRYREHNCDFTHLSIDVRFVPKEGRVIGRETLLFTPIQPLIDSVYLDAPGVTIKKVLLDKATTNVSFESTKEGVIVRFPTTKLKWDDKHSLYIEYEATPRKGLYFIGWNDEKNLSRKQIWTQGQGIDNRYWFPCYDDVDDKAVTETTITFDKTYTVISNGNLLDTKINADSTKTWHYAMTQPHSPYLVMLAIDKYAYKDYKSDNGITSREYYYADHPEVEAPTYQYAKEMMDWLSKEIGIPFPWQTYSNTPVQDFMFGAMENTTATVYGDFYQLDKRAGIERPYMGVDAHELTHQWFGDYITEYSATHHWLHESFATYYSKIFLRHVLGEDQYEGAKRGEAAQAIQADKENRYPIAHSKGGTARHYPKGSFVIGMLRYVVGDEIYEKSIVHYLKKHAHENVDTHDFYRTFMETAGINLDWFFDEWIYHSGVPAYSVNYTAANNKTTFYVEQVHTTDSLVHLFKMPIIFEVNYTDHTKDTVRVMVENKYDTVIVPNKAGKTISYTLFDPGYNILKTARLSRPYKEFLAQATDAPHMTDRLDAIQALRDTTMDRKKTDLIEIFGRDKSYNIRAEVVYQFRNDTSAEGVALLRKALKDENFNVHRAVADYVDVIPGALARDYEALLTDTSYVTIEIALRKLVKQYPVNKGRYLATVKNTIGISKNVRIAYLELSSADNLEANKNELIDYTSHSYEFRTRVKAMDALTRLNYGDAAVVKNLFDAIINPNTRLANPAEKTLKELLKKPEVKEAAIAYYKATTWKDWQQEKLKVILEL